VILSQNHRAVEGAGPYDPIIKHLDKPQFDSICFLFGRFFMNPKAHYEAARELTQNPLHKQLSLISVAAVIAANILLLLLQVLINHLMADAVGLSAMGKRTGLMTVQSVLQFAVSLALPFWTYGFHRVAMEIARKGDPTYHTLFAGFRRFGPLLRLMLLETIIATGLVLLGSWISTMLYMMTPFAAQVIEKITPALAEAENLTDPAAVAALMEPVMQEMIKDLWPMYLLIVIVLGALLIPWLYKLRLAPYHILDGQNSALVAMSLSKYEMHGNRFAMFRLDLQWWWYYGLLVLSAAPLYIYSYMGGSTGAMWAMTLLSYGLQFLVQWQLLPRLQTSYALAYDALTHKDETDVPEGETPTPF
jgi:uncharacterized membrane protein